MLSIQNITAGYDDKTVLHDITATAQAGQFIGIIGPNGSGKTTLLRIISGILKPLRGKIVFEGRELEKISRRELTRKMACLPQDVSIDLSFTVRQVTLMGRYPHLSRFGPHTQKDFDIAEQAMALADVSELAGRLITEISGGERQRALIAMCLAQQPTLLLLDEPTSHLDIGHQLSVLGLLSRLNRQNELAVIAVFHDLNLACEYCQKLMLLNRGRLEAFGSPQEVVSKDMIERVYETEVVVQENPRSGRPHIVISAEENKGKFDKIG